MAIDLSGEWIFDGRPFDTVYDGQMGLRLQQSGSRISGDLVQLQDPRTGQPPPDPEATRAEVAGEVVEDGEGDNHLVILQRLNRADPFRAVFLGILGPAQDSIKGSFVNTGGRSGTFRMRRLAESSRVRSNH